MIVTHFRVAAGPFQFYATFANEKSSALGGSLEVSSGFWLCSVDETTAHLHLNSGPLSSDGRASAF